MNINSTNPLNKMDCTFYFIRKGEDKTVILKEEVQQRICEEFASIMGVEFSVCVPVRVSEVQKLFRKSLREPFLSKSMSFLWTESRMR